MSNLSSEARRVIALARRADDPNAGDQQRVGRGLARRLGTGATAMLISVGTAKAAAGTAIATTLGKSVLFVAVSTAVALSLGQPSSRAANTASDSARGTYASTAAANVVNHTSVPASNIASQATNSARQAEEANIAKTVSDSRKISSPPASESPQFAAAREAAAEKEVGVSPTVTSGRRAATGKFEPLPEVATAAPDPNIDPLQAETAALREAQRALRTGDPASAISLTKKQDAIFRAGALGQERAAVRIFALCGVGNVLQARSEAQDFIRRWPRSPMLSRVRNACDAP